MFFSTLIVHKAIGKIPLDVEKMNIDLMSISGHKIYAPKGIELYILEENPGLGFWAWVEEVKKEDEIGNTVTSLCVGLGEACKIYINEMESENQKIEKLKNMMLNGIRKSCSDIYLNGSEKFRVPGNLNLSFAYIEGESLMMGIKNLAVSSGSACTSASLEPSYVLKALGV